MASLGALFTKLHPDFNSMCILDFHVKVILYLKPLKTQLIYRLFLPLRDTLCALFIAKAACPSPENRSAKTELNLALLVDFWVKNDKIIKI